MNKFKYYFVLLLAGLAIISCSKKGDDDIEITPPRDYAEQYKADNDSIVKYLRNNFIEVDTQTFDVKVSKITDPATQVSIWDQKTYPLEYRDVYNRDVTYRVYYLTFRKGAGEAPCNFDSVNVSYVGSLLNGTEFDNSYGLGRDLNLDVYAAVSSLEGWGEIMPKFKTGVRSAVGADGTYTYSDYGAGMMFLPSGLGYYASTQSVIPSYSPLVFSFKLYSLRRVDSEYNITANGRVVVGDGVPTYLEDINGDGYVYDQRDTARFPNLPKELIDDTDGDGIADFVDFDDDGDGYTTRFEITKPTGAPFSGISLYYPYNPMPDNPDTKNVDESEIWGIPRKFTGPLVDPSKPESATNPKTATLEDYTDPTRLRLHLDKNYHSGTGY